MRTCAVAGVVLSLAVLGCVGEQRPAQESPRSPTKTDASEPSPSMGRFTVASIREHLAAAGISPYRVDVDEAHCLVEGSRHFSGTNFSIELRGTSLTDISCLEGLPLSWLKLYGTRVETLSALSGMPLGRLYIGGTGVSDLSALKGMSLSSLSCERSKVTDLSPVKGMPLSFLRCSSTRVKDLPPILGAPLEFLDISLTPVTDLSPLSGAPLKQLEFDPKTVVKGLDAVRKIESLHTINNRPAQKFWQLYDAGAFR